MKDLPHHIKKLNRKTIRSELREEHSEERPLSPTQPLTLHQKKKQAKEKLKQARNSRVPLHATEEERNQKMKHRVPIFDRLSNAKPKGAKPSHKKTPKI